MLIKMKHLFFYLGLATLLAHELDAMLNHEWRVLPIIRALPDEMGSIIFITAHIPLFALLIALVSSQQAKTRRITRLAVAGFLVFHGLLHIVFKDHSAYEFSGVFSNALIFGGSILGILYLILVWNSKRRFTAR